jgi:hypothetical protein
MSLGFKAFISIQPSNVLYICTLYLSLHVTMSAEPTVIVELDKEIIDEDNDSIDIHLFDHSTEDDTKETRTSKLKKRLEAIHPTKKSYTPLQIEQGQTQTLTKDGEREEDQGTERGRPLWDSYVYIKYLYVVGMLVLFLILTAMIGWLLYVWFNQVTLHALVCENDPLFSTGRGGGG